MIPISLLTNFPRPATREFRFTDVVIFAYIYIRTSRRSWGGLHSRCAALVLCNFAFSCWRFVIPISLLTNFPRPATREFRFTDVVIFAYIYIYPDFQKKLGWFAEAKVSCILRHRGVKLRLAYSWTRPPVLAADKGKGGMFLFLLFLYFHSFPSFSSVPLIHLLYLLFYLSSPFLWEMTQNDPNRLTLLKLNAIKIQKKY